MFLAQGWKNIGNPLTVRLRFPLFYARKNYKSASALHSKSNKQNIKIMVHTTFTSELYYCKRGSRQVESSYNLYQVVINGEDGEYLEYEIEADSHSEASAKAEMLAAEAMVDISYIEVYHIH